MYEYEKGVNISLGDGTSREALIILSSYLVPAIPLGLLALVGQLAREADLVDSARLHLLVHRLLDPFELFLKRQTGPLDHHHVECSMSQQNGRGRL